MKYVTKIKLSNFRRFKNFSTEFDSKLNILIGDNESGKSTILAAINLVLGGSKSKVEAIGLENLFNTEAISEFLNGSRDLATIPKFFIEIYLNEQNNSLLNGRLNSDDRECDGLRLECSLSPDYTREVCEILAQQDAVFPFEYYLIRFNTFSGEAYTGYNKFVRNLLIDNSLISNEYAVREYVNSMYISIATPVERNRHENEYRRHKQTYTGSVLSEINSRLTDYTFTIRHNRKSNLDTDLTLSSNDVQIDNKGKGQQCFIKTRFALQRNVHVPDVVLLEEPENHLSHLNMKRLISTINESDDKQLFISTHSSMISARLDLRKTILLHPSSTRPIRLNDLPEATAKFFIKAPDHNVLDFILSRKAILVEGDAEYILMEAFYHIVTGQNIHEANLLILSVDGTSFKRYLDIAKLLDIRTAVVRDNDGNYQANCVDNYAEYTSPQVQIFSDPDNLRSTFEICLYSDNTTLCDELFGDGRRTLSVQEYMLKNKTEAAYQLLCDRVTELSVPPHITQAIEWIRG